MKQIRWAIQEMLGYSLAVFLSSSFTSFDKWWELATIPCDTHISKTEMFNQSMSIADSGSDYL